MRRTLVALVACMCLVVLTAFAMAQPTLPSPTPPAFPATARPTAPAGAAAYTFSTSNSSTADTLDPKTSELLRKWKAAKKESERDKIQKQLQELLAKQFQARLDGQEKELEQLEAKVKELRGQLALRRQKQDEIVEFRLQQLLRDAQGLGWAAEPSPHGGAVISFGTGRGGMSGSGTLLSSMSGGFGGGFGVVGGPIDRPGLGTTGTRNLSKMWFGGGMAGSSTGSLADMSGVGFEEFFKKFDTNGNGMLEEDEVDNTPAKLLVESILKSVGKEPKYPIAISEILMAIKQFPGRIMLPESMLPESTRGYAKVTGTATIATKVFSLESGPYKLTLQRSTEELTEDRVARSSGETRVLDVDVKNEEGKITVSSGSANVITGELRNNKFSGTTAESIAPVALQLQGTLTANNELSGTLPTETKDGQKTTGTFKLIKTRAGD